MHVIYSEAAIVDDCGLLMRFQGVRYMLLYLLANDGITHHHEICDLLK